MGRGRWKLDDDSLSRLRRERILVLDECLQLCGDLLLAGAFEELELMIGGELQPRIVEGRHERETEDRRSRAADEARADGVRSDEEHRHRFCTPRYIHFCRHKMQGG